MPHKISTHILEFNNHIQSYFISSTYGNETFVNKCLTMLGAISDLKQFDSSAIDNCIFFTNLHKLLLHTHEKSSLLWSAIGVLENACKCDCAKKAIVYKFRYLPVLSKILVKLQNKEKIIRLLQLIKEMTYGIRLDIQEHYMDDLIQFLVSILQKNNKDKTNDAAILSLSVLTNICYKNHAPTFILTKSIHVSTFCEQIKVFDFLACKMFIILECVDYIKKSDLLYMLKLSFKEIQHSLKTWSSAHLRHTVDYLKDIHNQQYAADTLAEYKEFQKNVEVLLTDIEGQLDLTTKNDEDKLNQAICMSMIFELLSCIIAIDPSIEALYNQIVKLAIQWVNIKQTSAKALDLIRSVAEVVIENSTESTVCDVLGTFADHTAEILAMITNNDMPAEETIAFFKMMCLVVKRQPSSNTAQQILNTIQEKYFITIYSKLLNNNNSDNNMNMTHEDLRLYLWSLNTLNEFANACPMLWFAKIDKLMKVKEVQYMIAKAMKSNDPELYDLVFQISIFTDFPRKEISEIMAKQCMNFTNSIPQNISNGNIEDKRPIVMNKTLASRIDDAASLIFEAKNNNEFNDVSKSEIIELLNHKSNRQNNIIGSLNSRLETNMLLISELSHQISLLNSENNKYENINIALTLNESRLTKELKEMEASRKELKKSAVDYNAKLKRNQTELSTYIKQYSEKRDECLAYSQQITKLMESETYFKKKVNDLQKENEDLKKAQIDCRKLMKKSEEENRKISEDKENYRQQSEKIIRERERDISKINDMATQLEGKLKERDEKIEQLELELKESEKIQETVMNLFNKKCGKK